MASPFQDDGFYQSPHISTRAEDLIRAVRKAGNLRPMEERVGLSFDEILDDMVPEIVRIMPRGAVAHLTDQDFADEVMLAWGRIAESRMGQALMLEDEMRAMSWQRRKHKRREIVNRVIQHTTEES
jgi:hypothetical protein